MANTNPRGNQNRQTTSSAGFYDASNFMNWAGSANNPMAHGSEKSKSRYTGTYINSQANGYQYLQDPTSMSAEGVEQAYTNLAKAGSKSGAAWNWFQKLGAQKQVNDAQARMMELYGAMAESLAMSAEAANRIEPAAEPLKQAQTAWTGSQSDTARKQYLRRGLMSTFTRYGSSGGAGKSQTLGA